MKIIQDYDDNGRIDWKDFLFYGLTITGNIIFTVFNLIH